MSEGFNFFSNSKEEEELQFSEKMKLDSDMEKLKEFYNEIKYDSNPLLRKTKMQCILKMKKIQKDLDKEHKTFIW